MIQGYLNFVACLLAVAAFVVSIWRLRRAMRTKAAEETKPAPARLSLIITRDQHQQLADLGYTREQRRNMTPEQAHNILKDRA